MVFGLVFLALAVIVGGWITLYVVLRQWVRAEMAAMHSDLYAHVQVAGDKLRELEQRVQELHAPAQPSVSMEAAKPIAAAPVAAPAPEEIAPEILAVISAAVAHFFGVHARIRQTRMVPLAVNPWAQQGRAIIQASHNFALTQRGHA